MSNQSVDNKLHGLIIALKSQMIKAKLTVTVTERDHWIALLDELNLWDRLTYSAKQTLYNGNQQSLQYGETTLVYEGPDAPKCNGTLVHSEFSACPKCDQ